MIISQKFEVIKQNLMKQLVFYQIKLKNLIKIQIYIIILLDYKSSHFN